MGGGTKAAPPAPTLALAHERLRSCSHAHAPTPALTRRAFAEVESWVMEAISAGLLIAKMNQVSSQVLISFCIEREFAEKQCGSLRESLVDWRDSIRSLLQVVQTARPQA